MYFYQAIVYLLSVFSDFKIYGIKSKQKIRIISHKRNETFK